MVINHTLYTVPLYTVTPTEHVPLRLGQCVYQQRVNESSAQSVYRRHGYTGSLSNLQEVHKRPVKIEIGSAILTHDTTSY